MGGGSICEECAYDTVVCRHLRKVHREPSCPTATSMTSTMSPWGRNMGTTPRAWNEGLLRALFTIDRSNMEVMDGDTKKKI